MKKYILTLVICIVSICAFSQEHLSFMGIPITGPHSTFCQEIKKKGFTELQKDDKNAIFAGKFTGEDAIVMTSSTDDGKNIYGVGVIPTMSHKWNRLVKDYNHYKSLYTEKYGVPSKIEETYNENNEGNNFLLMGDLEEGSSCYECTFNAPGGKITIKIAPYSTFNGCVVITYKDNLNATKKRQNDLDMIMHEDHQDADRKKHNNLNLLAYCMPRKELI